MSVVFKRPFLGSPVEEKSQISQLANAQQLREIDTEASQAGERIRKGEFSKQNLKIIFKWKNLDSRFYKSTLEPQFDSNSSTEITAALKAVCVADTTEAAVSALLRLKGIRVPTASAILTHIYPERFTVIDVRALNALGVSNIEIAFYSLYNEHCIKLAEQYEVSLRDLDRALWESGGKRPRRKSVARV